MGNIVTCPSLKICKDGYAGLTAASFLVSQECGHIGLAVVLSKRRLLYSTANSGLEELIDLSSK